MRPFANIPVLATFVLAVSCGCASAASAEAVDTRAFSHGIDAVQLDDGSYRVFFASSGNPPRGPRPNGNWTHDIYVSTWWPDIDVDMTTPKRFISKPEAQEPLSAARTPDGRIMLSFEDGWNTASEVNQRFGVYDDALKPVRPYPQDAAAGGHSGHVAATNDRFVVFFSEGWIDGGGVDGLGTGYGVYAKVYDSQGQQTRAIAVAPKSREWWPVLAASAQHALLLWQKYVPGRLYATLRLALLDPSTGSITPPVDIMERAQYYTYAVKHVPSIDRFLVTGTRVDGRGFAKLFDSAGQQTAALDCMPATVREAGTALDGHTAYVPTADNRVLHLRLAPQQISLAAVQRSPLVWHTVGNVGLMRPDASVHWISLTPSGVEEGDTYPEDATAPSPADLCRR